MNTRSVVRLLVLFGIVLFLSNSAAVAERQATAQIKAPPDQAVSRVEAVSVSRDDKGVWFISGAPDVGKFAIFEAMGHAVATDRLWQMELYRRQAQGRLAEVFGSSQLATDIYLRTTGYSPEELAQGVAELDPESLKAVQGYVAGINRRIAQIEANPGLLPAEFRILGLTRIEPWQCQDVLAWLATLQRYFDPEARDTAQMGNAALFQALVQAYGPAQGVGMFNDLRWTNDPQAQTVIVDETRPMPEDSPGLERAAAKRRTRATGKRVLPTASSLAETAREMETIRDTVQDNLKAIDAFVKMGSYAWVVSGEHTESGNPILYAGPQMGFSVPSILVEGSIRAGDLEISGMTIPGMPGMIIGRTPHHAWSMQVGHAHTTDYYLEDPADVFLHRMEIIKVRGEADVHLPVFRTTHGPVVSPMPYNPAAQGPVVAWKYAHWGHEFSAIQAFLELALAESMDEFGAGIEKIGVSQHFCYADRDGNIAYWMSGRDPVRPAGEWRLPQGFLGLPLEYDSGLLGKRSTARNPERGFFGGWNNKTSPDYGSGFNSTTDIYGPFHRSHVIYDYFENVLEEDERLSFADVRDLALNIAATDSFGSGGNPWKYVEPYFVRAVETEIELGDDDAFEDEDPREEALELLEEWDGHFVRGDEEDWAAGLHRADAWMLMDAWIDEVLRLTFSDELASTPQSRRILFNVLLHGLDDSGLGITNSHDWFSNLDPAAPQSADEIIVTALDTVLSDLGRRPWGENARGEIAYSHSLFGMLHSHPFSSRSTYAHCVEYGPDGPVRIQSMFPLGQSGTILFDDFGNLVFDENFYSMTPVYDHFVYREFPMFD